MLRIVNSDPLEIKEALMTSLIASSAGLSEKCMVIVPDQYSFEYDKMLYKALGAKKFNNLTTGGFNRICELLGKKHGGYAGENASENLSVIMMYLAIKRFKSEGSVQYYKKSLDKGSFIRKMIALVKELRSTGITPEALELASTQCEGMLSKKLFDIAKIYGCYMSEFESRELKDSSDGVSLAVSLAAEYKSFENADIYIDAFHSFTYDELRLIRIMLSQANSVTVSLMIGKNKNAFTPLSPFAEPVKTKTALELTANELGVKTEYLRPEPYTDVKNSIAFLNSHLFATVHKSDRCDDSDGIKIISACDIYEEAEYVCSEICRLVRDEGYSYNDCAVLIRDPAANRSALTGVFERYDIPSFTDSPELISQYSFVMYFEGLFKCLLTKKYNTENILSCIKSPLSDFKEYEASLLEDYCIQWGVDGDLWKEEFTAKAKDIPDDSTYLKYVNAYRKKIIEPFETFKSKVKDATAKEISRALYDLLAEIKLSEKSYSMVRVSLEGDDAKMIESSRQFRQLWELAVSCISAIFKNIPDEKLTLRQYYELIRTMFANIYISAPPQILDSVIIADSSHSRLGSKRAVFVMNCNDGVFPSEIKSDGLISDNEKQRLEKLGTKLSNNMTHKTDHERLVCYSALTASRERLYILWHESDSKGRQLRCSPLVGSIRRLYKDDIRLKASDMPFDFYCPTYKTMYTRYLEHIHDNTGDIAALRVVLDNDKYYSDKIDYIMKNSGKRTFKLDKKHARDLFFAHDINLSATRVETYYECPFNYFCKYGLKIYPPVKDKTDPRNRGTFVHSCLERIISVEDNDGKLSYNSNFVDMTDDELKDKIHSLFNDFLDIELGGGFGKTKRFDFISHRWEESAFYVCKNLREELKDTLFKPTGFEFDLTRENNESILRIYSEGRYKIDIRGSIDRVDIYEKQEEDGTVTKYVRIIDYKTGFKELKLEELYNGLNLQMLIYLLALTNSDNELTKDGELSPSGVLYMPAVYVKADSDSDKAYRKGLKGSMEEELEKYRFDRFRRFGLLVDNKITIDAMENIAGKFIDSIDVGRKKSKSVRLSENELVAYEKFAYEKLVEMADKLYDGKIEAYPLYKDKKTAYCTYCDYKAVCRNAFAKEHRTIDKEKDTALMKERIENLMKGEKKDGLD